MGNGTAKSRRAANLLVGDFVGDEVGDEGCEGDGMDPLGERDASLRVSDDDLDGTGSWGRSAVGTFGTSSPIL
jgi:hypothetical protein